MSVMVEPMPPTSLVELVNEWGTRPREVAGEQDRPYPAVGGLDLGVPPALADETTDRALTHLADRLYPLFAATSGRERTDLLTGLLRTCGVRPVARLADGRAGAGWSVASPRYAIAAAAALALREHLSRHGDARLGTCAGRDCADVYVDASPTHDRRYCSVTCQNRARVAAYRARRRG
ncbi:MAG TPA: CGNR zinc finger domain-containing protein [Actinocatenispora sp.]